MFLLNYFNRSWQPWHVSSSTTSNTRNNIPSPLTPNSSRWFLRTLIRSKFTSLRWRSHTSREKAMAGTWPSIRAMAVLSPSDTVWRSCFLRCPGSGWRWRKLADVSQVPSGSVKAQEQRRIGEKMLEVFSQFLLSYQGDPGELYECAGFSEFLKLSLRDGSYNPCTSSPSAESEAEKHRLNVNLPVTT